MVTGGDAVIEGTGWDGMDRVGWDGMVGNICIHKKWRFCGLWFVWVGYSLKYSALVLGVFLQTDSDFDAKPMVMLLGQVLKPVPLIHLLQGSIPLFLLFLPRMVTEQQC